MVSGEETRPITDMRLRVHSKRERRLQLSRHLTRRPPLPTAMGVVGMQHVAGNLDLGQETRFPTRTAFGWGREPTGRWRKGNWKGLKLSIAWPMRDKRRQHRLPRELEEHAYWRPLTPLRSGVLWR